MEAIAKHDFHATAADELSFPMHSVLKILNKEDDENWYLAEFDGEQGLIPSNYIEMKPHDWYYGRIKRPEAEKILADKHKGAFLVRVGSEDFALSVKCTDGTEVGQKSSGVQHFKVLKDAKGKFFLWKVKFDSLNELIEYHHSATVSRSQDIKLKAIMQEKSSNEEDEEEDEDEDEEDILVQALYDFTPQEDGELDFKKDDVITVIDGSDEHWWAGELRGVEGLFPAAYVTPYRK